LRIVCTGIVGLFGSDAFRLSLLVETFVVASGLSGALGCPCVPIWAYSQAICGFCLA
jgi:hypothetical protein